MALNIALLTYAFRNEILGASVCFNVDAKSYCPSAGCASVENVIGSGFHKFIERSVSINDLLVFDTFNK
jgi:hypothetical protein